MSKTTGNVSAIIFFAGASKSELSSVTFGHFKVYENIMRTADGSCGGGRLMRRRPAHVTPVICFGVFQSISGHSPGFQTTSSNLAFFAFLLAINLHFEFRILGFACDHCTFCMFCISCIFDFLHFLHSSVFAYNQ